MPKEKKNLCVDSQRHAEYYDMQSTFDNLYQRSKEGEIFQNLMQLILGRDNILLAYRNIKSNTGSYTAGTDNLTINDIGSLSPEVVVEKVRYFVAGSKHGYRPKPVRRKEIPKPSGATRPLGIPCIWDRLIQQCIKQILEPICEAKFSNNSYGFRPDRSVEHKQLIYNHSLEYLDCRQSLLAAQQGKCAISGEEFKCVEEIACCLKISRHNGGKEQYRNMVLVNKKYQPLIQGRRKDILQCLEAVKPDKKQLDKINRLRQKNGMSVVG